MLVDTDTSDLQGLLEAGRAQALRLGQDRNLTPQAQAEQAAAALVQAREAAAGKAQLRMAAATSNVATAEANLSAEVEAHEAGLDFARLSVAIAELQGRAQGVHDVDGALRLAEEATAADYYRVRAFQRVALPALRARAQSGALRGDAARLVDLDGHTAARLRELEPERIQAARRNVEAHQAALAQLRGRLSVLAANYAPGGPVWPQGWAMSDMLKADAKPTGTQTSDGVIVGGVRLFG